MVAVVHSGDILQSSAEPVHIGPRVRLGQSKYPADTEQTELNTMRNCSLRNDWQRPLQSGRTQDDVDVLSCAMMRRFTDGGSTRQRMLCVISLETSQGGTGVVTDRFWEKKKKRGRGGGAVN